MGQLGIEQDAVVTDRILAEAPRGTELYIATGYFNLTHQYMETIIYNTQAKCKLLMAHPNVSLSLYVCNERSIVSTICPGRLVQILLKSASVGRTQIRKFSLFNFMWC